MNQERAELIAWLVVEVLFKNGSERAKRLVQTIDTPYKDLGGWNEEAVMRRVAEILKEHA